MRFNVRLVALFALCVIVPALGSSCGLTRRNFRVEGSSMAPTLCAQDYLRLRHAMSHYERKEIIVFRYPGDVSRDFAKRIVGLPDETVEVRDGDVLVDGKPLAEPYILAKANYRYGPKVVPPGMYFVLGDNRRNSFDSHAWALGCAPQQECDFVPRANIIGWLPADVKGCKDQHT